ncbi:hypothetical protein TI03_01600 [Achromatium sp. WMS1]|nr:hypothetical protein TI03_01600 [Achromatium sp. WMS1]
MSLQFVRTIGWRNALIGLAILAFALIFVGGSWLTYILLLAIIGLAAYFGFRKLKTSITGKVYDGAWRYGGIVGAGLLVAMIATFAVSGWATILFVLGTVAVSLTAYAIVLSLQRMSLPNSTINVTTEVRLRAPRFRNWGRYVLKAEVITDVSTAKGKTKRLHTKRMQVKVHKEDFPEGRLVEACNEMVYNFVEKERQALLKAYPENDLIVDNGYLQQIKRLPSSILAKTPAITKQSQTKGNNTPIHVPPPPPAK